MPITAQTFAYFRELVKTRSAIALEPGKEYLVEARLTQVAKANGLASVDALAVQLARTPFNALHRLAVESMTTNETFFFRDVVPFEMLRLSILPELMKARQAERQLNIWCAASSSGQEPYSMAMMIREKLPELRTWKISFLATDLSTAMLAKARSGRYTQLEVNRGLPAALLVKYFTREGAEWQLKDEIRSMIEFRELNLAERWPTLPRLDLIMMRNVLIYFDVPTKTDILRQTRAALRSGGFLMLGGAETTLSLCDQFERQVAAGGVGYRAIDAMPGRQA